VIEASYIQTLVNYCVDPLRYHRRKTREVKVGNVGIGGDNPIRVQSMITCDTMDTQASIQETMELAKAGCEIVRITAPTVKDARNLENIVKGLRERGCDVPIVADIHFKPDAAMEAAKWVEKVRINPGNYADSKKFVIREYTDEQRSREAAHLISPRGPSGSGDGRSRFRHLARTCPVPPPELSREPAEQPEDEERVQRMERAAPAAAPGKGRLQEDQERQRDRDPA